MMEIIDKRGGLTLTNDGEGKGFTWSHQMGLQVCFELVHVLFKCIPLHD
jgi:hypothetical protein